MLISNNNYIYINAQDRKKLRLPEPGFINYLVYQYFTPNGEWFVAFINEPKKKFPPGTYASIQYTKGNRFRSLLKMNDRLILRFTLVNFKKNNKIIQIKIKENEHGTN